MTCGYAHAFVVSRSGINSRRSVVSIYWRFSFSFRGGEGKTEHSLLPQGAGRTRSDSPR